ncbi:MAG: xanthine dehydrogenase accessory factor [Pseudonocardiales bacterium]|nr:xanthine dehydrogenase accessory factor [Pseudonocardiales bacterium]MDT4964400.1 xanthine dehydrogenase accessory factor [Pseudonocardiales bacterium]MDT4970499.1 xanthine dehydrogenase accessory factor [Pseudonocardiales bacterium]MDT4974697.1 xanthine dehydrogenase accessory factor [Pseudonocardiales bacterium]
MRDVMTELEAWWRAGESVGVGTVVGTWKSAPRQPGASMLVGPEGTAVGSVSGGCVEGAVYELAEVARDDGAPVLQRYGVSDDDAFVVGLTCGGIIDIYVEQVNQDTFPELGDIAQDIRAGRPVAVATLISGAGPERLGRRLVVREDGASGSLGSDRLDDAVRDDVEGMLLLGQTGIVHYGPDGERRGDDIAVFVAAYAPPPRMIVFGAIDFAAAVARIGAFLGYRVTVCDARPTFATAKRFPDADEVVVEWPHRYLRDTEVDARTVVCVLTHDPKFDVPLLELALRLPVAYVGAMGSRRTNDDRLKKLRELGLSEDELARLHAPIGLDVGARTPEETAISVAAELIAARWNGSGAQLRKIDGPIHHELDHGGNTGVTGANDPS